MRKRQIAIVGMLLLSCLASSGCQSGDKKQESQVKTETPVFETAEETTETASAEGAAETVSAEESTEASESELKSTEAETEQENTAETSSGAETEAEETETAGVKEDAKLPDGVYTAEFHTDSSMFHVSEACNGKGTLTVADGKMTIHISLGSKKIVNLYYGLAADAAKDGAELLQPTVDTVTYSDGMSEEVYGFDVPVPALDEEFDVALIGTKKKWYDHKVSVSNPQPVEETEENGGQEGTQAALEDGTYTAEVTLEGGSGRASIESPAQITVKDGAVTASIQWSSPNYDYMIVDGEKYLPVNTEGNSVFEIPVSGFDQKIEVIADTTAMSKPHEIEYTLTFDSSTIQHE